MIDLFIKGGPIMWPILVCSIIALGVVIERVIFMILERKRREPLLVEQILAEVEMGRLEKAVAIGANTEDFVARPLVHALQHVSEKAVSGALLRSAGRELRRFGRGLSVLDTIITLAPLLGLLGTVTGMIHSFGLLGEDELGAPTAITGGIAEALLATGFGLAVAIVALIPFNYLNTRLEDARHQIQDAAAHLEILLNNSTEARAVHPESPSRIQAVNE